MKDKLLDATIENTKNSSISWYRSKSIFNSDSSHIYECILSDKSLIKIEIHLDKDTLNFSYCNSVEIVNKKFVDGKLYIFDCDNKKVGKLGELVYQMYISPTIVVRTQTQDQILNDIITSIPTKAQSRDNKISEIISSVENKFPWAMSDESKKKLDTIRKIDDKVLSDKKSELVSKKIEKKSKLKRIFDILFENK